MRKEVPSILKNVLPFNSWQDEWWIGQETNSVVNFHHKYFYAQIKTIVPFVQGLVLNLTHNL